MLNNFPEGTVIRPLKDCVLVVPDRPSEEQLESGLIAPAMELRPIDGCWATVVADGEGLSHRRVCTKCERPLDAFGDPILAPGTRVLMDSKTSGDALMIGSVEHRMVRKAELLAWEEPDA